LLFTKGVEDDELATQDTGVAIPLQTLSKTLRKKEMEEEIARMAEERRRRKLGSSFEPIKRFSKGNNCSCRPQPHIAYSTSIIHDTASR
jgi:hypothetical protein